MSQREKLQAAVQTTMAAGYQLNREAFEFLTAFAVSGDPAEMVHRALQKMEELEEKPLFIGKEFLETLIAQPIPQEQMPTQIQRETQQVRQEETKEPAQAFEGASAFQPYAKDVEAQISIIEDSTGKLSSDGTMEEYLRYFQDRFKRLEKLLRQRMDVKAATPIMEALKSPAKTKLKIIGMVTEKREARQQLLVTVEDLQASATILVPSRAPEELRKKAQMLLPDQVICVAVAKTRSFLFLAEDIIFPEVGQKPQRRASEPVYAVLTSDLHVGSAKFNKEPFKRFILWLNGRYGDEKMREVAGHVKYVLMAGDVVDGIGVYPGQAKELAIRDIYRQYRTLAGYVKRIPEYIEVFIIPGDHDAAPKALPQPAIAREVAADLQESRRVHLLPNPCSVSLHGVEVLLYHGRSLLDIATSVPGIGLQEAYKAMKVLVQSRHLAPVYGQRTQVIPAPRDFLVMDRVPDILHTGHLHLLNYETYRGVLMVNSGCWQAQTEYQEKSGIVPTPNVVPVINLQTREVSLFDFGS